MWQPADNRAARATATDNRDLNGPPQQVGMNGVHSVLPALDKCSECVAALHQKLATELSLAPRQIPPQSQEPFRVRRQARADRSMSEFAFKERLFPALHRFEAQFSWCPHTRLSSRVALSRRAARLLGAIRDSMAFKALPPNGFCFMQGGRILL